MKIRRALLSVTDKAGIVEMAQTLHRFGCELISTGGTGKVLGEAGLPVTDISHVTGNPEAFGGRMKTISFAIESAILFDREKDAQEAQRLGIAPIDMVVCNLYPFTQVRDAGAPVETLIENIDIGGPTMIRAAAKNYKYVAAVTDPADYSAIIEELGTHDGALSLETRARLMGKAFNTTADYDAAIAQAMDEQIGNTSLRLGFSDGKTLRYGENWHQAASLFRQRGVTGSLLDMEVLNGKELSFNNIVDITSAVEAVRDLCPHGCAVIKHTNPCGLSECPDQRKGFELAWAGDPVSAFGSVIAFNSSLEQKTAEFLNLAAADREKRKFVEVVIAPEFNPDALSYLQQHDALRVIRFDPGKLRSDREIRVLGGACLVQKADDRLFDKLECVTEAALSDGLAPGSPLVALLEFGLKAVRQIKSNTIVIVRRLDKRTFQLLGMGAGQPNRVVSAKLALDRAAANLRDEYQGAPTGVEQYVRDQLGGAILVSDAFFPFPDTMELAANAGVKTVFQPGGSVRDEEVIRRANELGVAMVMTGVRHFKH